MAIRDFAHHVRHGTYGEAIRQIRQCLEDGDHEKADRLKKSLPAVSLSGLVVEGPRAGAFEDGRFQHSGYLQGDFDAKDFEPRTAEEIKAMLASDEHVQAAFRSARNGVKAIIRIPVCKSPEEHKAAFGAAESYFRANYALELDAYTKDPARLCYVSYDPDAHINPWPATELPVAAPENAEGEAMDGTGAGTVEKKRGDNAALKHEKRTIEEVDRMSACIPPRPDYNVVEEDIAETIYLPGEESRICDSASNLYRLMAERGDRFLSSGKVARIGHDGVIELLRDQPFRSDAERYGKLLTPRRVPRLGLVYAEKPMTADIAKALLAADERHGLPPLSLLTELPVLVETDGAMVLTGQGYNPDRGGIYVKRQGGLDPDNLEFDEALKRLRSLLVDFDFVSVGDYARAFAGFITPALRMGGWLGVEPVPVFVGEALDSQTGKGYIQDLTAAIYGEQLHQITKKKGGVGSLDESIASALVTGRPLLQIDNVRGKVDSQLFEMSLTAKGKIPARIPYSGDIQVNPTDRVWFITSNGMETTPDLANRSCIIRLRKRPEDYAFTTFPEGAALDHVKANAGRYLEAVFRVVAQWFVEGKPRMTDTPHDFRVWARTLDWITDYCLDVRLMEGHRAVQNRISDPALTMLREIALRLSEDGRLGEKVKAHDLGEICDDYEIKIPGLRDGAPDDETAKQIGRRLARVFKKEQVVLVDEFTVCRAVSKVVGGNGRDVKTYTFTTNP